MRYDILENKKIGVKKLIPKILEEFTIVIPKILEEFTIVITIVNFSDIFGISFLPSNLTHSNIWF